MSVVIFNALYKYRLLLLLLLLIVTPTGGVGFKSHTLPAIFLYLFLLSHCTPCALTWGMGEVRITYIFFCLLILFLIEVGWPELPTLPDPARDSLKFNQSGHTNLALSLIGETFYVRPPQKMLSMFPVVHPKTAMHDAFFKFLNIWIEKQQCVIFFINRRGRYTHTNNYIGRGHILFDISFTNKSETDSKIFDLTNKHYWCLQHVQVEKIIL